MFADALKYKKCTKCFGCCYLVLELGWDLDSKKKYDIPIGWYLVPINDGTYENLAICTFTIIVNLQPSCLIQNGKPKSCVQYVCWEE